MKVKLVFEKSFTENRGLSANTFSADIEVDLPEGFDMAHLVSARCYDAYKGNEHPSGDMTATVCDYTDESYLVGKLLTHVDATFTDPEQRKAHKDITKDLIYGYFNDLRQRASQIIESQTKKIKD